MMTMIESGETYTDVKFKNDIFSAQTIKASTFVECHFERCKFVESAFERCAFEDCIFSNCDLSLAKFPATSMIRVRFEDSKLIGINWTLSKWMAKSVSKRADFVRCNIQYSAFMGLPMRGVQMTACAAHDVNFTDADLQEANCAKSDFMNSRFAGANLSGANFVGAINYRIDFQSTKIKKAKFSLPEALALLDALEIEIL